VPAEWSLDVSPPLLSRCCCWNRSLPTSPARNRVKPSGTRFLWAGPSPSCRRFSPAAAGLSPSEARVEEETLLAILLLSTEKAGPRRGAGLVPVRSPLGPPGFAVAAFVEGYSRSDPGRSILRSAFSEVSPQLVWSYGPVALSPLLWVPEVQVSIRSAEDTRPPPLTLSPLASQRSPLQWYMAWNAVASI